MDLLVEASGLLRGRSKKLGLERLTCICLRRSVICSMKGWIKDLGGGKACGGADSESELLANL